MKDKILDAAMKIATRIGYKNVTRDGLAEHMGVASGTITFHIGNMRKLRREMIEKSIQDENVKIFTEALVDAHPLALAAPQHLKNRAARALQA